MTLTVLPGIRAMTVCPYLGSLLPSFIQSLVPYNHYYSLFHPLSQLRKLKRLLSMEDTVVSCIHSILGL